MVKVGAHLLGVGVVFAFFDAFGIGANDVANSFATSVNSGVFTMTQAAIVATIFEFVGAVTAGGKVSKTIQKGILAASKFTGREGLMQLAFVCALIGSSTWLQLANYLSLPVSTTHSIVGGVIGVGVAAFGVDAVQWGFANPAKLNGVEYLPTDGFGPIWVSWLLSPIISAGFAVIMFALTKYIVLENNALSTRIHRHSFWRAVYVAPFFYAFVGGILVLLLAYKGVSSASNAGDLAVIAKDSTKLGLASGLTALAALVLSYVWVSWWQVRVTWNGENLTWFEWFYHPFIAKRAVRPGFDLAHHDWDKAVVVPGKDAASDAEAGAVEDPATRDSRVEDPSTAIVSQPKEEGMLAFAHKLIAPDVKINLTLDSHKVKIVPAEIEAAMKIAEASGYVVREMDESEKVMREYKKICSHGTMLDRLLCPFRAFFCHGICGANGEEREVRHYAEDDPRVKAMHDISTKYDDKTEEFFKQLQMTTSIIASFAHGSNDVANAMGPFSVIYGVYSLGAGNSTYSASKGWPTDTWILAFGGAGISIGFLMYGYHLMRSLGNNLTYHSPSRGYTMEFGASITVILASQIGLPISTTQCITGATIGVGAMSGLRAVNWSRLATIFLSWMVTVPTVAIWSGLIFAFSAYSPNLSCPRADINCMYAQNI